MEIGPQPHGSVRSNVFVAMQEGIELMLEWIRLFNSGTKNYSSQKERGNMQITVWDIPLVYDTQNQNCLVG